MILLLFVILLNFIVLAIMYVDFATVIDIHALADTPFVTGLLWWNLIALGICLIATIQASRELANGQKQVNDLQCELAEEKLKNL